MVHEHVSSDDMRAEARALREQADLLEKAADIRDRIRGGVEKTPRRSTNWKTADDLEIFLQDGKWHDDETILIHLADSHLVKGDTREDRISNGRKALTLGAGKGYLERKDGKTRWISGQRVNTRVRKNI